MLEQKIYGTVFEVNIELFDRDPSPCVGFPGGSVVKNPPANAGDTRDIGLIPGSGRFPWRRKWQPTPVFLPEASHGQRSLADFRQWDHKESNMAERLSTHTVL